MDYNSDNIIPDNHRVYAMDIMADKKLLVGGEYFDSNYGFLYLLDENGNFDKDFSQIDLVPYSIRVIKSISDNKIVYGGYSKKGGSSFDPIPLFEMNLSNQSVDSTSISVKGKGEILSTILNTIFVLSSYDILIGGNFSSINETKLSGLSNVTLSGNVDQNFIFNTDGSVKNIIQYDTNSLIIAGGFSSVGGIQRNGVARIIDFNFSPVTGITESEKEQSGLSIYPNPSDNILNVVLNDQIRGPVKIYIYSPDGIILRKEDYYKKEINFHISINIGNIAPGFYLLRTELFNRQSFTTSFIKR